MTSEEQNIVFDNIYEDIALRLDYALDEVIEEIEDDWEIGGDMVVKIIETWSLGVSARIPLTVKVDEKTCAMMERTVKK
jgi:hypothetical protein